MLPGAVVLSRTGAAVAADFANATGAPIVGNTDTGLLYWYANGMPFPINFITPIGAAGDGVTDDYVPLQAAINRAFAIPSATLLLQPVNYATSTTLTLPDTAGTLKIVGMGKPKSYTGGVNGDPTATQGAQITFTGAAGDVFSSTLTGANKRQYITLESFTIQGNSAATSGHGIHFTVSPSSCAILPLYKEMTVNGAKQHGIFHEGNVFESGLHDCRCTQNGDRGFKASATGSGIPGETRFYDCVLDANGVGMDLTGGGSFALFGTTLSANTNEGLIATGIFLQSFDLQLEINGTAAGNQVSLNVNGAQFYGVVMTVFAGGTGNGFSFTGGNQSSIRGFSSNSGAAGAGYADIRFSNTTNRCLVEDAIGSSGSAIVVLGTNGGHVVRNANQWLTGQSHAQQTISLASGTAQPDSTLYDDILVTVTSAATITMANPLSYGSHNFQNGQILSFEILNSSGGVIGTNWGGDFLLAGAWVSPANGKRRTVQFHWNGSSWVELGRAAADI